MLNPDFGVQKWCATSAGRASPSTRSTTTEIVIYGILIAGLWQGTGLVMCLMLAGLRGIDEEIWKAARVDGIPKWKTYLFIVIPMMRPVFITTLVIIASGIVASMTSWSRRPAAVPALASEVPAKYVYDYMFVAQNLGQGFAASTMMLLTVAIIVVPWAYSNSAGGAAVSNPGTLAVTIAGADAIADRLDGPHGPKPRIAFSRRNIMVYGALIVAALYYLLPLYVMVVTSLKGMPEIRLGNIFAPPLEITFEPWVKAWATACTGLNCDGLSARLLELGAHHRAERDRLDRDRLGERLRAGQLALQGRRDLLHDPDRRLLHPLSGDDLSDRHHAAEDRHLRHALRPRSSCIRSSACRS